MEIDFPISKNILKLFVLCFSLILIGVSPDNSQGPFDIENSEILPSGPNGAPRENSMITTQYGPTSAEELKNFMDEKIPELMSKYHVLAFMFSYVKGDKILFNKGYGIKKPEATTATDAENDVLVVGSVAKVIVLTAIIQQIDQGKLQLDDDVNKYLDFKIENSFNKKITIKNLLQHTAGFEDTFGGQAVTEPSDRYTLKEYVKNYVPHVVYPPGEITSYSNYGYNLLAHIVERTSGKDFDEYAKGNIFAPLEMDRSEFVKNTLLGDLKNNFIRGFSYSSKTNTYKEQKYIGYWIAYPAGALVTNTRDLGNFMLMYLNGGTFKGKKILSPESLQAAREEVFTPHKDLSGQALGFTTEEVNGHVTLEKSGEALNSVGQVVLFPDDRQGFSFSFNTSSSAFNLELRQAIADKFFSRITQKKKRYQMPQADLRKFAGFYRYTRYNQSDFSKLMIMMSPQHNVHVKANDDGTLSVGVMFLKDTITYEPISKDSFQKNNRNDILDGLGMKLDLGERIAFRTDDNGRPDYLFIPYEKVSMERISLLQYGMSSIFAILFSAAMAVLVLIYWPLGKLIKLLRRKDIQVAMPLEQNAASWIAVIYALLEVIFVAIIMMKFNEELMYGIPIIVKLGLFISTLSIPVFLALLFSTMRSWLKKYWTLPTRIIYTVFTLSILVFAIFVWNYNLVVWK